MRRFDVVKVAVTTAGDDGDATGSAKTAHPVNGKLYAVHVDYHGSAPATTDVTIAQTEAPAHTLLTLTDENSDGMWFPREQVHSNAGVALTLEGTEPLVEAPPVAGNVTVSVAGANALTDCVVVRLFVEV